MKVEIYKCVDVLEMAKEKAIELWKKEYSDKGYTLAIFPDKIQFIPSEIRMSDTIEVLNALKSHIGEIGEKAKQILEKLKEVEKLIEELSEMLISID